MKVKFLVVGKTTDIKLRELIYLYTKKIGHYVGFEHIELNDIKKSKKTDTGILKELEGELILTNVSNGDELILLDERGNEFTSMEFADFLEKKMVYSSKNLVFVVGGAYGFAEKVYRKADNKISLSQMTFSHQMIRLFFTEQLYRALTIIKGEPYHHE